MSSNSLRRLGEVDARITLGLLFSCRSKTSDSSLCIVKFVCDRENALVTVGYHKLGDPLAVLNRVGDIREVLEQHAELASVIAVYNSDAVAQRDAVLGSEPAPRKDKSHFSGIRKQPG